MAGGLSWWHGRRAVPDEPGLPSAEELAVLPHGELAERLAEAYRVIAQLTAQVREMAARVEEAVAENGGRRGWGPWSGGRGRIPPRHRSRRRRTARKEEAAGPVAAGEGEAGAREAAGRAGHARCAWWTTRTHRFWYPPAECRGCGTGLAGQEVFAQRRHQVTDIKPAPPPEVTEHVAQSKMCPCCGTVSEGELPSGRAGAGRLRAGSARAGGP